MLNKYLIILFFVEFIFFSSTIMGQQESLSSELSQYKCEIKDKSLFILGETHIYGFYHYYKQTDNITSTHINNKTTQIEIATFLVDSLDFNLIALELPKSHEYLIDKYIETNNPNYLFYYDQDDQMLIYFKKIRQLYNKNTFTKIRCIDHENSKSLYVAQISLILILFDALNIEFEFNPILNIIDQLYYVFIKNVNSDNFLYYPLKKLLSYWNNYKHFFYKNCCLLFTHLNENKDIYKKNLSQDFELYTEILSSVYYSHQSRKENTYNKRKRREFYLAKQIKYLLVDHNKVFCVVGNAHVYNNYEYLYGKKYHDFKVLSEILYNDTCYREKIISFLSFYPKFNSFSIFSNDDYEILLDFISNNPNRLLVKRQDANVKLFNNREIHAICIIK